MPDETMTAVDEYDQMAEHFYRRTGLLCPGKSYPPDMDDGATEDHRSDAWTVFKDYYRKTKQVAALVEALKDSEQTMIDALNEGGDPADMDDITRRQLASLLNRIRAALAQAAR